MNLGALTSNSDLKDTYGAVRVEVGGVQVEAGLKAGSFIGDNVKASIGTLIYTGKRVGFASHVHGVVTEDVPPYTISVNSLGAEGNAAEVLLDSTLVTQERAMARRNVTQTPEDRDLMRVLFSLTQSEREVAGVVPGRPTF